MSQVDPGSSMEAITMVLDVVDYRVVAMSEAARLIGGVKESDPLPRLDQLVADRDVYRVIAAIDEAGRLGRSTPVVFSYVDGQAQWHVASATIEDRRDAEPAPGWLVRFNAGVERPLGSLLYEGVTRYSSEAIYVVDEQWRVVDCNAAVRNVFGVEAADLLGEVLTATLVLPEHYSQVVAASRRVMAGGGSATELLRYRSTMADGRVEWFETRLTNLVDDPLVRGVVANTRIVTEEQEALEELRRRAERDPLTGLPNRFVIERWLREALQAPEDEAQRLGPVVGPGRLQADQRHLRPPRRGRGAAAGVESTPERLWRPTPMGRFGGDEFVVSVSRPGRGPRRAGGDAARPPRTSLRRGGGVGVAVGAQRRVGSRRAGPRAR